MTLDDVLDAIDAEPEYPGEMSEHLADTIARIIERRDIDFFVEAMRLAVETTKAGIRDRVTKRAAAEVATTN